MKKIINKIKGFFNSLKRTKALAKEDREERYQILEKIEENDNNILTIAEEIVKAKKLVSSKKGTVTRAKKGTIKKSVKEAEKEFLEAEEKLNNLEGFLEALQEEAYQLFLELDAHDNKFQKINSVENVDDEESNFVEDPDEENEIANRKSLKPLIIASAIMMALIIIIIIIMNCCTGGTTVKTQKATVPSRTVASTTVQPTTIPMTTVQPTTKAKNVVKKEEQNNDETFNNGGGSNSYSGGGSNSSSVSKKVNVGDGIGKYDMDDSKDSSKDDGKTGGNSGYDASLDKESPSPEKIFEEEHPLPATVSQEEINKSPTVALTPRKSAVTVDNTAE